MPALPQAFARGRSGHLYALTHPNLFEGKIETVDRFTYPAFDPLPLVFLLGAAALVTVPPVLRALRIDPSALFRSE